MKRNLPELKKKKRKKKGLRLKESTVYQKKILRKATSQ